jgi:flagellar assembly protein FliH
MTTVAIALPRKLHRVQILPKDDMSQVQNMEFEDLSGKVPEIPTEPEIPEIQVIPLEDAETRVQEAYDQGFEDGKQVATATMAVEIERQQVILKNFDALITRLHAEFDASLRQMEESIVSMALILARSVITETALVEKSVVIEQARKAIAAVSGAPHIKIRLHPADITALKAAGSSIIAEPLSAPEITIAEDDLIEPGGCIVESPIGAIDAQISTQIEQLRLSLLRAMNG